VRRVDLEEPALERHALTPAVTIHRHASAEGGIYANAFLVESERGVVAIDASLSESESKTLRSELEAIGKPLLAVLITHPHPDHVGGITNLIASDTPQIVATQPVLDLMRRLEEPKRKQWGPVYGAEWVARWTYPNRVAASGEKFVFDGVAYRVLDLGAGGDAEANSVWWIDAPARAVFLGDLVFNGTHAYVADGHLLAWLANLTRVHSECADMARVFPGHGASAGPEELFAKQRDYLLLLAANVQELRAGGPTLSDANKEELTRRMQAFRPDSKLEFLIAMSADPIARELST
jgi:glyoxylase-like metal-dependent hydrolase (beta-lactamase superfamily II)